MNINPEITPLPPDESKSERPNHDTTSQIIPIRKPDESRPIQWNRSLPDAKPPLVSPIPAALEKKRDPFRQKSRRKGKEQPAVHSWGEERADSFTKYPPLRALATPGILRRLPLAASPANLP